GEQALDLLFQFVNGRIHLAGNILDEFAVEAHHVVSGETGNGLDAAHAGGNRTLADNAEQADLARGAGVGAAAQFHRITVQRSRLAADLDDADGLAVFLTEELEDVLARLHVGVRDFGPTHAGVFDDALVDELLDVVHLRERERGAVEIKGQLLRTDIGTFLRSLLAHDFVQGPVEQVGDGVVELDGVPARFLDREGNGTADGGSVCNLRSRI